MSFGQPLYLLALLALPLAVVAYARHERARRAAAAAFAAPALQPAVAPHAPGWRRHVPLAAYGLALAVLVVALARPQATVAVPVEQASIMLAIDYSGSMQATDVPPTRLEAARAAAGRFLDQVPDAVRVGLVAFNHSARLAESPTTDRAVVRRALDTLRPSGGTATGEALAVALSALARQTREGARVPAAVILLSDGKSVRGRPPQELARRARELKIPIHAVTLGTPGGTIDVRRSDGSVEQRAVPPDPIESRAVAELSGGRPYGAETAGDLSAVYEELGSRVGYSREQREITAAFAGGALVLLAGGALASLAFFRRIL